MTHSLTKLRAVAAAAGTVAALAASAPAHAYVYAASHLQISNLQLIFADPNTVINNYTFTLKNSASLNGGVATNPAQSASCNSLGFPACGAGPVLNAAQAIAPTSNLVRPEDTYSFATAGEKAVSSFSRGDSIITSAQLVTGFPTSIEQIAESLLNISGNASANAEITSNTNISATATFGGNVTLSFLADTDQLSQLSAGAKGLSQSNVNASFSLTRGNGRLVFTPSAGGNADCLVTGSDFAGVTCSVSGDTETLNFNTSLGTPGSNANSFEDAVNQTPYGLSIAGLAQGTYGVAFNAVTSTSIIAAVPEPGSMALVGIALAGLGAAGMRSRQRSIGA